MVKLTDAQRQRAYSKIAQGGTSSYFPGLTAAGLAVSGTTGKFIQAARAQRPAMLGGGFVPRAGAGLAPRAGPQAGAGIFDDIGSALGIGKKKRGKRSQGADFTSLANAGAAFAPLIGIAAGNPQAGFQAQQGIQQLQSTEAGRRAIAGKASTGEQLALASQFSPQLLAASGNPGAARAVQLAQTQNANQLAMNPEFLALAAQARSGGASRSSTRNRRTGQFQKKGRGVSRPGRGVNRPGRR